MTHVAGNFLLKEAVELKYGAWHLEWTIEQHVVSALARLLATEQVV